MQKPVCVFILGNGFSQGFGFPSSLGLWDDCLRASPKISVPTYFEQSLEIYPVSYFRKNYIRDIELLLSVWSVYIANYQDLVPDYNNQVSGRGYYESYLENLCGHLLEYGDKANTNKNYSDFKNWIKERMFQFEIRFITLNYDLVLEKMISEIEKKIVYLRDTGDENDIFIRKLHGSANWLEADTPNLQRADGWKPPIIWNNGERYIYNYNADYSFVPFIAFKSPPVIIPPIIGKKYDGIFTDLVGLAKEDLRSANFVFVVGYSLPAADILIRELLKDYSQYALTKGSRFVYINSNEEHCKEALRSIGANGRLECIDKEWNVGIFDTLLIS